MVALRIMMMKITDRNLMRHDAAGFFRTNYLETFQ